MTINSAIQSHGVTFELSWAILGGELTPKARMLEVSGVGYGAYLMIFVSRENNWNICPIRTISTSSEKCQRFVYLYSSRLLIY